MQSSAIMFLRGLAHNERDGSAAAHTHTSNISESPIQYGYNQLQ